MMVLVADPQQLAQDPFAKTALSALECLLRAGASAGLDELKRRVRAMSRATRKVKLLLDDCKTEQDAVDFYR